MTAQVRHDGTTVTVTTDEGHRIGFPITEIGAPATSGEITTEWAGGVTPRNTEVTVQAAKSEAERHMAEHHPDAAQRAREVRDAPKSLGETLKGAFGIL